MTKVIYAIQAVADVGDVMSTVPEERVYGVDAELGRRLVGAEPGVLRRQSLAAAI